MKSFKQLPAGRSSLSYEAAGGNSLRKQPVATLRSEDDVLSPSDRKKVVARSRDLRRNSPLARWAINKHLDFVSSFRFRPATGNKAFDAELSRFMDRWSKPGNCDASGRYSLRRLVRMIEGLRVVDGDLLILKLADGRVQLVEGDRVRDPEGRASLDSGLDRREFTHGVKLGPGGKPAAFAVHKRTLQGQFEFERLVDAGNAIIHGYFDRFDQVRGISPAAASLNVLKDVHQNFDYALTRAKLSQLYGLVINRKAGDDLPEPGEGPDEGLEHPSDGASFEFDPNGGPVQIDLDVGEEANLLQSDTPSNEFQVFNQASIALALKAIDIPYSFYDEAYTNFFGSRAALQLYLRSAEPKREDNRELLDDLTSWRIGLGIADGELDPAKYGLTFADIFWSWTPSGFPWWDVRDVTADLMAVHAGFKTRSSVIEEKTGETFEDVADRLAEEEAYLREKGLSIEGPTNAMFEAALAPPQEDKP